MAADGMPAKLLRVIKAYFASTMTKVRVSGLTDCLLKYTPAFALSPTLFIDCILGQALQGYPGVQAGTNVHVSGLGIADGIVLFSNNYREMQGLLETVNHHTTAVGMRIYASKTKVMSALIPCDQRQAVLLEGEP